MIDQTVVVEGQLMRLARHFSALSGRSRRKAGVLDQSAYTLLYCLNIRGRMNYADLQRALGLDLSTLNRQMNALLRAGYAIAHRQVGPRAATLFAMTELGRAAWTEEHEMTLQAMEKLLEGWTGAERALFAELLNRFNGTVESFTGLVWPVEEVTPDRAINA